MLGPIAEFGLFGAPAVLDNGILTFVIRIRSLIIFL
jgi:hypothetical protein